MIKVDEPRTRNFLRPYRRESSQHQEFELNQPTSVPPLHVHSVGHQLIVSKGPTGQNIFDKDNNPAIISSHLFDQTSISGPLNSNSHSLISLCPHETIWSKAHRRIHTYLSHAWWTSWIGRKRLHRHQRHLGGHHEVRAHRRWPPTSCTAKEQRSPSSTTTTWTSTDIRGASRPQWTSQLHIADIYIRETSGSWRLKKKGMQHTLEWWLDDSYDYIHEGWLQGQGTWKRDFYQDLLLHQWPPLLPLEHLNFTQKNPAKSCEKLRIWLRLPHVVCPF